MESPMLKGFYHICGFRDLNIVAHIKLFPLLNNMLGLYHNITG